MTDNQEHGRSPADAGSGYSAEPEPVFSVSAVPVSIPNAAAARIEAAIKRALAPLDDPNMDWVQYRRRLAETPSVALECIRDTGILFREPEQADWPLLIEAWSPRPYSLTVRTQMKVGDQTLGFDQQMDDRLLYERGPMDQELARHMSKHAIRATLEAVAEPFYAQAAVQFASAIEARRAETHSGSVADESAVAKPDARSMSQ